MSEKFCLFACLLMIGCVEPSFEAEEPSTDTTELALGQSPNAACVPTHEMLYDDVVFSGGPNLFGFSHSVLRGPRDCGGQRLSRGFYQVSGNGWCDVISDSSDPANPIFWANELCARNPNMKVWNSTITQACQEFRDGGSDLGDRDCRYIVHVGGPVPADITQCRPFHRAWIAEYCPPPPPLCRAGSRCCEFSDDRTTCDLCVSKRESCY